MTIFLSLLFIVVVLLVGGGVGWRLACLRAAKREALPPKKTTHLPDPRLLHSLPFPAWIRDHTLTITAANAAYYAIAGVRSVEGETEAEGVPLLDSEALALAKRANALGRLQEEDRHIIVDGARYFYHFVEMPMIEKQGQPQGLFGYGWDNTASETRETELSRHISAQSNFLESSSSAMAIFDMDRKLRFYNQAFKRCWGLDERWLAGSPNYRQFLDFLHETRLLPEQANFAAFKKEQLDLFTNLLESHNDFWHLPDGRTLHVIVIPHALGGLLFAFEDMTDKLTLERSHNTLIAVQSATLDNLQESVAVFAENGRLKLYNKLFLTLWRLEAGFCEKQPHMNEVLEKTQKLFKSDLLWQQYQERTIISIVRRQIANERVTIADTTIDRVIIPLPDGATLLSDLDVSDSIIVEQALRKHNDALEAVQRVKAQFLAHISYELRTPLTSIIGLSEMLSSEIYGPLNAKQQDYIEGITNASQQLSSMINDILDVSSIEAGYFSLDVAEFDLIHTIRTVFSLLNQRVADSALSLTLQTEFTTLPVEADEKRIKQVLLKLLTNAIICSKPGGIITVHVVQDGAGSITVSVKDQGVGIPADEIPRIFDAFYRTNQAMESNRPGVGLGLSVVKNFIELHGGHVWLDSTLNEGTRVTFQLKRYMPTMPANEAFPAHV